MIEWDDKGDYYSSPEWIDKREQRLEIDKWTCRYCGSRKNLSVHHLTYDRFGDEIVETDLVTVCNACHTNLHSVFAQAEIEDKRKALYFADYELEREIEHFIDARFAIWVWPHDVSNGGTLNLSDMQTLSRLRKEFYEKTGLYPQVVPFHAFLIDYKNKIVDDLFISHTSIERINKLTGVSKRRIAERKKLLMAIDWNNVQESKDFVQVPAGPYVIRIIDVEDVPEKQYNNFIFDIAEGEYENAYDASPDWAHRFVRSYKETALGMYKAFFLRVEDSSNGFTFDGDVHNPKQFIGKIVGVVLREEEYCAKDGTIKTRLSAAKFVNVDDVRSGLVSPMPKKVMQPEDKAAIDGLNKLTDSLQQPYDLPF